MAETHDRAKEYLVYAPVGMAYFLRDTAPTFLQMFVARGRTIVAPHEHAIDAELARAKSMGQLTVMFGRPEVEKRIAELRAMGESVLGEQLAHLWPSSDSPTAATAPTPASPADTDRVRDVVSAGALGIDAYDALSASQVIERLDGLTVDERAAVEDYELAHRNRKTILSRLEQLRQAT